MSGSSETEFRGKRALVTGGTKGMGEAIVQRLRRSGATVVTTARSVPADLPHPELFVAADISAAEGVGKVLRHVRDQLGGVDILINNVGGSSAPGGGFAALSDDDWQAALNQNLLAAVRLDRGLLPSMLKQGSGVIIHISSIQRRLPLFEATLAYAAAKAGIEGFVRSLAVQLGPQGVRVNAIAPGMVWTPMVQDVGPELREKRRRASPLGTEGEGWDVGWAAVYLASDEARWVTGQTLVVDGGLTTTTR